MATYISCMVMCITLALTLLVCSHKNWKQDYWRPLLWIHLLLITAAACDILWILVNGRPEVVFWNYFANIMEYSSLGWIGYCWYCYCCNYYRYPRLKTRRAKLIAALPALIITLFVSTTGQTGFVFYVDPAGIYHRGPLFFLQPSGYIYLFVTTFLAIASWRTSKFFSQKKHLFVIISFVIAPCILGPVQLMFPPMEVPTLHFSMLLSLLLVFANDQESLITHDALTGLINRCEFEHQLDENMARCRKSGELTLYLLVGDVDHFKAINDGFGHRHGDEALKCVASALSVAAVQYRAVAARVSGDEFTVIMNTASEQDVQDYISCVGRLLSEAGEADGAPLSISLGYVKYDGKLSLTEFFESADLSMYHHKKVRQTV